MLWDSSLELLNKRLGGGLREFLAEESFHAEYGKSLYLPHLPQPSRKGARLLLCGAGGGASLNAHRLESALATALRQHIALSHLETVAILLSEELPLSLSSTLLALIGSLFHFSYRSREAKKRGPTIKNLLFYSSDDSVVRQTRKIASELEVISQARSLAMDLVNMPPNLKTTRVLVREAQELRRKGLQLQRIEGAAWIEKQMPAFYTVARGSLKSDPPCWIHLRYQPPKRSRPGRAAGRATERAPGRARLKVALVGKTVMFDTGGYQVKPDEYMTTMKADMTGGATTLAVLAALEELKPHCIEVHGFLAATANMIDSHAFVPDSIIDTTCGKKAEILHTDAEGRLTLIDAVAMAEKEEPDLIITVATLTGSAARAVGMRTALMSNSPEWRQRYEQATLQAGDPFQSLEVEEEDFAAIESKLDGADLRNVGRGKNRGAQTAAAFVMSGIREGLPLLHLDIAGGDMSEDGRATGIAVKGILSFLLAEDARLRSANSNLANSNLANSDPAKSNPANSNPKMNKRAKTGKK